MTRGASSYDSGPYSYSATVRARCPNGRVIIVLSTDGTPKIYYTVSQPIERNG